MTKKSRQKLKILWERKELLKWHKKHFSSFLKVSESPRIVSDLRVCLNNYKKMLFISSKKLFLFVIYSYFHISKFLSIFPVSHWPRGRFKINLDKVQDKVYDVSICLNKKLITHFVWYIEKKKRYDIETLSIDRVLHNQNIFMEKSCRNDAAKASPRPLLN